MDNRKWLANATGTPPTPPASPSIGYPANGDPNAPTLPTNPGDYHFYALGEELRNIILAGGLTPSDSVTQVRDAIIELIRARTDKIVRVASTAPINLSAPGANIDGVAMVAGDAFLEKDHGTGSSRGVYIWNGAAVPATRAPWADDGMELASGMLIKVREGAVNADTNWQLTTDGTITIGTTALNFIKIDSSSASLVGATRNLKSYLATANQSSSFTADEIVLQQSIGGIPVKISNFNKSINLATNGLAGMDSGAAPINSFVGVYAIYNPSTGVSGLLATNASSLLSNVYAGANMPAGFTHSALIAVWPTNASGQMVSGLQIERSFSGLQATALNTSAVTGGITALSISSIVPANAKFISGNLQMTSTSSSTMNLGVYPSPNNWGTQGNLFAAAGSSASISQPYNKLPLSAAQTLYYIATSSAGTPAFLIFITSYDI